MRSIEWSVIVPTYERPSSVARTVESLHRLRAPDGGFDITVVDDGGTADLRFLRERWGARVVHQQNSGPARARNAGACASTGKKIAFIDDDCVPDEDWLLELDRALKREPNAIVGGHTINALPDNSFSVASQQVVDFLSEETLENLPEEPVEVPFLASNNIGMTRETFEAIGMFDTSFPLAAGEDRALCDQQARRGEKCMRIRSAVVYHYHDLGLLTFWAQHVRYGRGAYLVRQLRSQHQQPNAKLERLRYYYDLVRRPVVQGCRHASTVAALLGLAQVATAWGYFREAARRAGEAPPIRSRTA